MKRLIFTLSCLLVTSNPEVQHLLLATLGTGCTTPTGTGFWESFGDSSVTYGALTNTTSGWVNGSGTPASIVTSPGSPASNTACTYSLHMAEGAANPYIRTAGPFIAFPTSSTFDITAYIYLESHSLAAFDAKNFFCLSNDTSCGTYSSRIKWRYDGTNFGVVGDGSTTSSQINTTLTAWHTIVLHVVGGSTSTISVDGGGTQNFTANNQVVRYLVLGGANGNAKAITFDVGYLKIDYSGGGQMTAPSFLIDGTGRTSTTVLSASELQSGMEGYGVAGLTWGGTFTTIAWSNAITQNLLTNKLIAGTSYAGNTGISIAYDVATTNIATGTFRTASTDASCGFFVYTTVLNTDTTQYAIFRLNASPRFAVLELHGNGSQLSFDLEYDNNGSTLHGSDVNISNLTQYWVAIKYLSGVGMELQVYDTSPTLIGTSSSSGTPTAQAISAIDFGHVGSSTGIGLVYYSNIVCNAIESWAPAYPIQP